MKTITLILLLMTSLGVFAANKPAYQVDYHLSEKGKVIGSSRLIIEEGVGGQIRTGSDADFNSMAVTVKPSTANLLSVDYRFKSMKNGKSIELAKTAVALAPGASETNDFKDSSGNGFELKITVTKK
jgi:hypothetical protein